MKQANLFFAILLITSNRLNADFILNNESGKYLKVIIRHKKKYIKTRFYRLKPFETKTIFIDDTTNEITSEMRELDIYGSKKYVELTWPEKNDIRIIEFEFPTEKYARLLLRNKKDLITITVSYDCFDKIWNVDIPKDEKSLQERMLKPKIEEISKATGLPHQEGGISRIIGELSLDEFDEIKPKKEKILRFP